MGMATPYNFMGKRAKESFVRPYPTILRLWMAILDIILEWAIYTASLMQVVLTGKWWLLSRFYLMCGCIVCLIRAEQVRILQQSPPYNSRHRD